MALKLIIIIIIIKLFLFLKVVYTKRLSFKIAFISTCITVTVIQQLSPNNTHMIPPLAVILASSDIARSYFLLSHSSHHTHVPRIAREFLLITSRFDSLICHALQVISFVQLAPTTCDNHCARMPPSHASPKKSTQ